MATVRSSELDLNGDGRRDQLRLKLEMPLKPDEAVYQVELFLFFDVQLHVILYLLKVIGLIINNQYSRFTHPSMSEA